MGFSTGHDIGRLLQPERGNPDFDLILRSLSEGIDNNAELSIIKNTGLIMSFYTLPILKDQANNMSIITGYIISFLELKYGIKKLEDSVTYVTKNGEEIEEMIKSKFNLELIHQTANQFSEQMLSKNETAMLKLQQSGLDVKSRSDYFKRMSNMYKNTLPNGKKCFNEDFTNYFESLFRTNDTVPYETELLQRVSHIVQKRRKAYSDIATHAVGEQPMIREQSVAMRYDVAPSNIVKSVSGNERTIQEYNECRESALQHTYTGYIKELRDGYRKASEKAHTLIDSAADDTRLDILVAVAYLTQSRKLLEEPEGPKGLAIPEWKQKMIDARDDTEVIPTPAESEVECNFYDGVAMEGSLIQQIGDPHTTLLPIPRGRHIISKLIDRSLIPDQYDDDIKIKLKNLQEEYISGLEEVPIADLFGDGDVNVIGDGRGQERKNYAFGTLPPDSERSIQVTHDEHAKKAREMKRVIKHMSGHTPIPDWMRQLPTGKPLDSEFKPWGQWDDPQYRTDLTIRSIRRIQNLGISLLKILRWLGAPATDIEMDMMNEHINRVSDSNVIGADGEFKTERDQLDAMGYVLKDLFDIKRDRPVSSNSLSDPSKLAKYESHFIKFYQMSYYDYQRLTGQSRTQMRNLVHLAIRVDLIKHIQYIGVHGQSVREPLEPLEPDQINITEEHSEFLGILAKVLNALIKHGGSEIVDPDRSKIDWRYEERFKEFANKRKVTSAHTVKKDTGLNINTPYAGPVCQTGEFLDSIVNEDEEEEFDPFKAAASDDYDENHSDAGDSIAGDERLGDGEADANMFQGEVEDDFDPMNI
jgi:hypothetical protein